ncbi:C4-dicarboxylate transporter large subunit [Escherichia coli]|uniref:C4-dicarboxylate transporter large subunit n=1 Tax=Escherichia coli TaxID=562 RepID=A0A2X1N401_ECOLX|nr:C4-dicarboxylate transporter large subunit [Escherichia coli]
MLILVPLLKPVVEHFGIDPVHFGIIMIFNLSIGAFTPPVGTVMLLVCNITQVSVGNFFKQSPASTGGSTINANAGDIYPGDFTVPGLIIKTPDEILIRRHCVKTFPSSPRYLPRPFYAAQLASRFLPQPMFHAAVAESGTLPQLRSGDWPASSSAAAAAADSSTSAAFC